ncbi:MAG: DUF924 family protein [Novosphingobium sp.]|nr:DUF924 domain-containing protein [Novosphingobium sp.]
MTAAYRPWAAELLHFWFDKLRPNEWFGRSAVLDGELRKRFGRELQALGQRPANDFLGNLQTARAAVLLFDQLPRNLFRDSPNAFACDPLARAICKESIARGWDSTLGKHERQFLYMPLMHSEAIADQLLSLRLYAALNDSFVLSFARAHYRMIARFGRFPHRSAALGRKSTSAEERAVAAGNAW